VGGGEPILSVRELVVEFETADGVVRAVDEVSLDVHPGETVGVVGESGSGKSVTALSVLRLLPAATGRIRAGAILFEGRDLLTLPARELRRIRGRDVAMVFQDPTAYLNPSLTIGRQLTEAIRAHDRSVSRRAADARAVELLGLVGIPSPAACLRQHPHQYSGGMRQRVMIAMAIANRPKLLIADEPTTALDVTIQAQVVELLKQVQAETGAALMLITHDLGLAAEIVDRVIVLYAGRVMEDADVRTTFADPRHPYTVGLLASLPRLDVKLRRLPAIPGQPPTRSGAVTGCVFQPRCLLGAGRARCAEETPPLLRPAPGHRSACHFVDEVPAWREALAAGAARSGAGVDA
jgi:oligopeptide/dipeptide ABC transporter ATP-binding protein